jgi:mono/diheme cytochrome c family protein
MPNVLPPRPATSVTLPTNVFVWDAETKTVEVKEGETMAKFTFYFTNVSSSEVSITALRPSCGCTAAKLPETPWKIAAGQSGPVSAEMNVQGSYGMKTKGLTVETSAGNKFLTLTAKLPPQPTTPAVASAGATPGMSMQRSEAERSRNLQSALSDRQAPLKGDCAKCHVEPTAGKYGRDLYVAACGICHNAERRAEMVVDLQERVRTNSVPFPAEYWNMFVTMGKPGTLMPAFAKEHGGFMTREQVSSLVDYLVKDFPKEGKIIYKETSMGHAGAPPTPVIVDPKALPATPTPKPTAKGTNVTAALLPAALNNTLPSSH